jgi:sulfur carrier protein
MEITLNNRIEVLEDTAQMTVQQLIEKKNFTFKFLVTKINGKLVKRDERDNAIVRDGDDVAIIHLISGG